MTPAELEDLARRLQATTPAQKLFMASELMKRGRPEIAIAIAENVVLEYQSAQLFEKNWKAAAGSGK